MLSVLVGECYIHNMYHQAKGGIYVYLNASSFVFLSEQMSSESNRQPLSFNYLNTSMIGILATIKYWISPFLAFDLLVLQILWWDTSYESNKMKSLHSIESNGLLRHCSKEDIFTYGIFVLYYAPPQRLFIVVCLVLLLCKGQLRKVLVNIMQFTQCYIPSSSYRVSYYCLYSCWIPGLKSCRVWLLKTCMERKGNMET